MSNVASKTVSIYIDTGAAQEAIDTLNKRADKLREKIKQGQDAGKDMNKELSKLDEIGRTVIDLRDKVSRGLAPSFQQVTTQVTRLRNELKHMSEDDADWADKFKQFQDASTNLEKMREKLSGVRKEQKSWLSEMKGVATGVIAGEAITAAVDGFATYVAGIVTGNAAMSDSMADIEKSTGLTTKQVSSLNKELSKIDTRTKGSELREIAIGLGLIGEAANKANVEAIDKIVVALGDEFTGGAKEITTALSILRNNLTDFKTGNYADDVSKLGNALNELGAAGLASAPVVTDTANRMAGIARAFKVSSAEILGVAASFQELGIEGERGSTAVNKIFQLIASQPEKFSKIAGMEAKAFKELVDTNMVKAFQLVAEGAQNASASNVTFGKVLKQLDADGSGAGEVLSKLGANSEILESKIALSNAALQNTNSITSEFNKKNTNMAAELEKLGKAFTSLVTSQSVTAFIGSLVNGFIGFIKVLKQVPTYLKENQTAVYLLVTGILVMNAAYIRSGIQIALDTALRIKNAIATRISTAATLTTTAAQAAYAVVTNLLTGRITLAAAAQRLWNIALSLGAGPIGVFIIAAGALTMAISKLVSGTEKYNAALDIQTDAAAKINESVAAQKEHIADLVEISTDHNQSLDVKKKAIAELIAQNPAYLQGLTLENINTREGIDLIDNYVRSLDRLAKAKALRTIKEDANKQIIEQGLDLKGLKKDSDNESFLSNFFGTAFGLSANSKYTDALKKNVDTYEKVEEVESQIKHEVSNLNFSIEAKQAQLKKLGDPKGGAALTEFKRVNAELKSLVRERNTYLGLATNETPDAKPLKENPYLADLLAGKQKKKKAAHKDPDILKKLKDFDFELQQIGKTSDDSEIARITKKYNELMALAAKYHVNYLGLEESKNRAIKILQQQELDAKRKIFEKEFIEHAKEEYARALELSSEYFDDLKDQEQRKYADGQIGKKQYTENVKQIDREALSQQIMYAEQYSAQVKQAETDLVKFKKQKRKEDLKDAVEDIELKRQIAARNRLADRQIAVALSPQDSKQRLDAQLKLWQEERDQALANEELTESEKEKIRVDYRVNANAATLQYYGDQVKQVLELFSSSLDVLSKLNDSKTAKENAALDAELKRNNIRRNSINQLERNRVISSSEAQRRLKELDLEEEKRKEDLSKKQAARAKKIAIAQAIVNGAMAITSTLAAIPGPADILSLGTFRAIQIGLAVATTAAQIKTIASTKYGKGGRLRGPSHAAGGMPVINPTTGETEAEVEGGEYIISKATVENNKPLADALLHTSMNKGGAQIKPFWEARPYRQIDFQTATGSLNKIKFATGGVFGAANTQGQQENSNTVLLSYVQQSQATNAYLMQTVQLLHEKLNDGIEANVNLNKMDDKRSIKNRIIADARMK